MKYLLSLLFLFSPLTAFAASHNYVCADLTQMGQTSCSSAVWTMTAVSFANNASFYQNNPGDTFTNGYAAGTTLYFTFTHTGTGEGRFTITGNAVDGSYTLFSGNGTETDKPVVVPSGNTWSSPFFNNFEAPGNFVGTISNLTISDTCASCSVLGSFQLWVMSLF